MYIKNKTAALIYRLILLIGCGTGLFINFGFIDGRFNTSSLIYYTNLSNLICFLYFIPLTVRTASDTRPATFMPRVKGMFTMMITVTLLIYHSLLANWVFPVYSGGDFTFWLSNVLLHYITPLLVILDWLLFCPKRAFRWHDPLIWAAVPISYVIAMLIRAEIGGTIIGLNSRFPYFFLDIDAIGWGGMLGYSAVISLIFVAIGYLMTALDRAGGRP